MKSFPLKWLAIIGGVGVFLAFNALFIVRQTEQALVFEFGAIKREVKGPGLHVKVPFIQDVERFDKRLLEFNAEPKEVIASDQKRLIVDAFVRYRIVDPLRYRQAVKDEFTMRSRLNSILESSLRQVVGGVPLKTVLSPERPKIMEHIREIVRKQVSQSAPVEGTAATVQGFGIEVVDVRIMRADLPPANSQAIFHRMQTEREREAKEFRAQGAEEGQRIRAESDRERVVLIANAERDASIIRGEGEAQAAKIYAEATTRDPEFYAFYRTMQAYRRTLKSDDTTMVLSPNHDFLKMMEVPGQ